jgi:hypothetical protein
MHLHYILHKDIDFEKWDKTLQQCSNSLIYAESIYLNTMAKQWNAIVTPDYDYIMPVPLKRKVGIQYVPIIPFVQQLGVFSSKVITSHIIQCFIELLSSKIKLVNYNLNYQNTFKSTNAQKCDNYVLPLNNDYDKIKKDFKKDFRKYLKSTDVEVYFDTDHAAAIKFFKDEYRNRNLKITEEQYRFFKILCDELHLQGRVIVAKAVLGTTLLATALILKDEKRLYNVCSTISVEGKKFAANHFLFDSLIQKFANTHYLLDFEGSDIDGIAYFYKSMGGINHPYQYIELNELSTFIKLFKK